MRSCVRDIAWLAAGVATTLAHTWLMVAIWPRPILPVGWLSHVGGLPGSLVLSAVVVAVAIGAVVASRGRHLPISAPVGDVSTRVWPFAGWVAIAAMNWLVLLVPGSDLVPGAPPSHWHGLAAALRFRLQDAIAVDLGFLLPPCSALWRQLLGTPLLANTVATISITAVAIAGFAVFLRWTVGHRVAIITVVALLCDRWVLISALAGHNVATAFFTTSASLLVAAVAVRTGRWTPVRVMVVGLAVGGCGVLMLHTYAIARVPGAVALVVGAVWTALLLRRAATRGTRPVVAAAVVIVAAAVVVASCLPSHGLDIRRLEREIHVLWFPVVPGREVPSTLARRGIANGVLAPYNHNDVPSWIGTGRVEDPFLGMMRGDLVNWRRSAVGTVAAVADTTRRWLIGKDFTFPGSRVAWLLFAGGLVVLGFTRRWDLLLGLGSGFAVAIAPYLLVPDPIAYRRGVLVCLPMAVGTAVAATAAASVVGHLVAIDNRLRRLVVGAVAIGLIGVLRLPAELAYVRHQWRGASMAVPCTESPWRSLVSSPTVRASGPRCNGYVRLPLHPLFDRCVDEVVDSRELRRVLGRFRLIEPANVEDLVKSLENLAPDQYLVLNCGRNARHMSDVTDLLCSDPRVVGARRTRVPAGHHQEELWLLHRPDPDEVEPAPREAGTVGVDTRPSGGAGSR